MPRRKPPGRPPRGELLRAANLAGLTTSEALKWVAEQMRPGVRRTPEDDSPPRLTFDSPQPKGVEPCPPK